MTLPTAVRLRAVDDLSNILVELENPAGGLKVIGPLTVPEDAQRQYREKYARVGGSFGSDDVVDDDGTLGFTLRVRGGSWPEVTTRWLAVRSALRSRREFYVEHELSGVRTRYFSDAPVLIAELPITNTSRVSNTRRFDLTFLVQPNPSIVIV